MSARICFGLLLLTGCYEARMPGDPIDPGPRPIDPPEPCGRTPTDGQRIAFTPGAEPGSGVRARLVCEETTLCP
jgi:hypothetical protein